MRWCVLFLLATLVACGSNKKEKRVGDPAAGHWLLAEYVASFQAIGKSSSLEALDPLLVEQAAKGESLKAAGKVPAEFAERHRRLIDVTRALIAPNAGDKEKQQVRDFLDAIEGKKERALTGGLAEVAPAIAEEVLRLHMLLDGTSDREKTRALYVPDLVP